MILEREAAIEKMNELGIQKSPFFFFTDFLGRTAVILEQHAENVDIQFDFNAENSQTRNRHSDLEKKPISFEKYNEKFTQVIREINFGNSFLVNLTFKTPISTSLSLQEIFDQSSAKYKVKYRNDFVCFSPETFVKIIGNEIFSYPMKGTIDAALPNAKEVLLGNPKELAEHVTIVDLIRNDLSQVADNVNVTKFRFMSEIKTKSKNLLQVSSEVKGEIRNEFKNLIGSTLFRLLPAGSISGAPKNKTVDIINNIEATDRGFYTGICGFFDGQNLDSGVMIRFIEQKNNELFYRSGGGITSFSNVQSEYQEMIDKIYLPI